MANINAIKLPDGNKYNLVDKTSGYITGYTETDPTVPSWAKASTKPSYEATEIGLSQNTALDLEDMTGLQVSDVDDALEAITTWSGTIDEALDHKQTTLVSGTNIKTINNESLLGSGNITTPYEFYVNGDQGNGSQILGGEMYFTGSGGLYTTASDQAGESTIAISHTTSAGFKHIPSGGSSGQILGYGDSSGTASWTGLKTINNTSLLGSGDISITDAMLDFFYPVGSYYETSDTSFNPNTAWGGTWVLETGGQVHVSAGTGYPVTGAPTDTSDGGATTSATGNHTLVENELPNITGTFRVRGYQTNTGSNGATLVSTSGVFTDASGGNLSVVKSGVTSDGGSKIVTLSFGNNDSHNHGFVSTMQPYIVVNRWHRTA